MNILFVLVPLALLLAGAAVFGFMWAVRHGQFDDVHTPAMRMLMDDDELLSEEQQLHDNELTQRTQNDEAS